MTTQVFSEELKYTTSNNNHSSIQYRNVTPQATNTVTTSINSSTGPTEFIISPAVVNLSLSRLEFSVSFTTNAKSTWINANFHTIISRLVMYDSGTNALLMDISNFEKFASLNIPISTKFSDFISKSNGPATLAPPQTITDARSTPYEDISRNAAITVNLDGNGSDIRLCNPVFGRQQTFASTVNTAAVIDVSIPFSSLKSTVLGLNKLLYSPSNLVLQIYWSASNNFSWLASTAASPTAGQAPLDAAPVIANLNLALACESNLNIISEVISTCMGGLELQIPYPSIIRTSIAASTSQSYSLQLTRAYGNRILYIMTSPFNVGATPNVANEHGVLVNYYNTFLNSVPIKLAGGFTIGHGDDYLLGNKEYLKGSVVQTIQEYRLSEWCHVDSWVGEKPLCEIDYTLTDGLDVGSASSTFQIQSTSTLADPLTWINVIVGQKTLKLSSMGTQVM